MTAKTILIVEEDEDLGMLLQHALKSAGYSPVLAADSAQAISLAEQARPDLIITDYKFPPPGAVSLHQRLRTHPAAGATPILVLSSISRAMLPQTVVQDAGTHYLSKPYKKDQLLNLLEDILLGKTAAAGAAESENRPATDIAAPKATILIVEDDRDISAFLKHSLEIDGHTVIQSYDGPDALQKLGLSQPPAEGGPLRPDLIILDIILPVVDGYTIGTQLKDNDQTRGIPILVLTAKRGMKELFRDAANVAVVLDKPLDIRVLKKHIVEVLLRKSD